MEASGAQEEEISENKSKNEHQDELILEREQKIIKKKSDNTERKTIRENKSELNIWLLNIRGITQIKMIQLLNAVKEYKNNIICLTETHEKYKKVDIPGRYKQVVKRRKLNDKKGGGMMILVDQGMSVDPDTNECQGGNPDLLHVKIRAEEGMSLMVMLIYMDTKDQMRNTKLQNDLDKMIEEKEHEKRIVLGDFNGHIGYIGKQKKDINGKYVDSLVENFNLVLLNGDDRCKGEVTREENGIQSTIDFMLTDKRLYKDFVSLEIDEKKEIYDLSDHCVMKAKFETKEYISINQRSSPENMQYFSVKEEFKIDYLTDLRNRLRQEEEEPMKMEKLDEIIRSSMDAILKRTMTRRFNQRGDTNPVWFTREIEKGIKLRRHFNRLKRNADQEHERNLYNGIYKNQKRKVQVMVKDAISQYEKRLTKEVRRSGGNLWKNINKLRGEKLNVRDTQIYDLNGVKMAETEAMEAIEDFWKGVYHRHENRIEEKWNEPRQDEYREEIENKKVRAEFDIRVPRNLREAYDFVDKVTSREGEAKKCNYRTSEQSAKYMDVPMELIEHYEMVARNDMRKEPRYKMESAVFTVEEVRKELKRLKKSKKPGPDGIKSEIYGWIGEDRYCLETITRSMNGVMESGKPPNKWKKSTTLLIPKKSKPTSKEMRPLAMTDVSYKVFMSLVKEKLLEHLEKNEALSEYQAGFTRGRRIEDNIVILKYCIGESYREGKPLYVASIDFAKAFDSIKRESIMIALQKYKCHPGIIEVLAKLYSEDVTTLMLNGRQVGEVEVKSGIRQGCTLSPLLFILVVNYIIDEIVETQDGFRNDVAYVPVLFFADDGLLISQSEHELRRMIVRLTEAAEEVGLGVNKEKSNIIIFNIERMPKEVQGIAVTNEIRYLGVTINNTRDCFKAHKARKMEQAAKMANMTYSVIARSCNKLLIGKTYWKGVVLPTLLYGAPIIDWNEKEIEKLQKIENTVWRCILGGPGYTPNVVLRGEIGASTMKSRIIKSKLTYTNWTTRTKNGLLAYIIEDMFEKGKENLVRRVRSAVEHLNTESLQEVEKLSKGEIERVVRLCDEERWRRELEAKTTVQLYCKWKSKIKEERIYDNTEASTLLFRARSNTLKLGWRGRYLNTEVTCRLCGSGEEETLDHFLVECETLREMRESHGMRGRSVEEILLFCGDCEVEKTKAFLVDAWRRRKLDENRDLNEAQ